MEKVGDIMAGLGFQDGARDSVKAAFVQNLIYQAYGVKVEVPEKYKSAEEKIDEKKRAGYEQLIFNLDDAI